LDALKCCLASFMSCRSFVHGLDSKGTVLTDAPHQLCFLDGVPTASATAARNRDPRARSYCQCYWLVVELARGMFEMNHQPFHFGSAEMKHTRLAMIDSDTT